MPLSICKGNKVNKLIKKQQQKTSTTKKTDSSRLGMSRRIPSENRAWECCLTIA